MSRPHRHHQQHNFDFMVGADMSPGAAWASTVMSKGKEDPYLVASTLSCLWHSKVIIQSDGEPASDVVMSTVQSKAAVVDNHHMTSSSSSHSDTATRATEEQNENGTNHTQSNQSLQNPDRAQHQNHHPSRQSFAHMVTTTRSMAAQAIPQTTRLNNYNIREDSTHV